MSDDDKYKVRLMRWSDSSATGKTVTFRLPDDIEEHPFKGLPVGAKLGQMVELQVSLIEDGGTPRKTAGRKSRPAPAKPAAAATTQAPRPMAPGRPPAMAEPAPSPTPPPDKMPPSESAKTQSPQDLDQAAAGMSDAARSLAAAAQRMEAQMGDNSPPPPPPPPERGANSGAMLVRRAADLCRAVDKQRAAFFYYMMSRYPKVPPLPAEKEGSWSRDAQATRDRVCFHCDTHGLDPIGNDDKAAERFCELENDFERHDRMR